MTSATRVRACELRPEDCLAYLPYTGFEEYGKGDVIYSPARPSRSFHLVMEGEVAVIRLNCTRRRTAIDIYRKDEFFGEAALLGLTAPEEARALEDTKIMSWSGSQIHTIMAAKPSLAIGLLQMLVRRTDDFTNRIESLYFEDVGQRLIRTLLRLADRIGGPEQNGWIRMIPLSHALLAQYVGTGRELITQHLLRLRRKGFVRYSRKAFILQREPLLQSLRRERRPEEVRHSS